MLQNKLKNFTLFPFSLKQMISVPNIITENTITVIDHVFTKSSRLSVQKLIHFSRKTTKPNCNKQ